MLALFVAQEARATQPPNATSESVFTEDLPHFIPCHVQPVLAVLAFPQKTVSLSQIIHNLLHEKTRRHLLLRVKVLSHKHNPLLGGKSMYLLIPNRGIMLKENSYIFKIAAVFPAVDCF